MTASIYQVGLGASLGDNIAAVFDTTSKYCIFSVVNGGWRKNVPVDVNTCAIGDVDAGYISPDSTTWKDISTWNSNPGSYWVENLTGCVCNLLIYCSFYHILRQTSSSYKLATDPASQKKIPFWERGYFFKLLLSNWGQSCLFLS